MNKNLLKSKMVLHGDTFGDLAEYLGISLNTFSLKINGKAVFTQDEIKAIKIRYNLTAEEVDEIFLN